MGTLPTFFDLVYVNATETSGLGPFTLGSALTGFHTAAKAGIADGTPVSYRATDGTNFETAHGVVHVSGSVYTLSRGVDVIISSNSPDDTLYDFTGGGVVVLLCQLSQDLNLLMRKQVVQWSEINGNTNAVAGNGYLVDTSGGVVTLTLPASPVIGDRIGVVDLTNSFNINNLTVAHNGNPIGGVSEDMTVSIKQVSFDLVFGDATNGWRVV